MTDGRRLRVGVAECRVTEADHALATSGLGSCVAVAVFAVDADVGGLLHAMVPGAPADGPPSNPARYVDTGVARLVERVRTVAPAGATLHAKVAGGSRMFSLSGDEAETVGDRNLVATAAALREADVPVAGKDIGGTSGRSVTFRPATGAFDVRLASGDHRAV